MVSAWPGMCVGEARQLLLPAALGYGADTMGAPCPPPPPPPPPPPHVRGFRTLASCLLSVAHTHTRAHTFFLLFRLSSPRSLPPSLSSNLGRCKPLQHMTCHLHWRDRRANPRGLGVGVLRGGATAHPSAHLHLQISRYSERHCRALESFLRAQSSPQRLNCGRDCAGRPVCSSLLAGAGNLEG